jgi:hypothetical protein
MRDWSDLRFRILTILSDNNGHTNGDLSRLLGVNEVESSDKSKRKSEDHDKGNLSRTLSRMTKSKIIVENGELYNINPNIKAFSCIIDNCIQQGRNNLLKSFLESNYVGDIIYSDGIKLLFSSIKEHFNDKEFLEISSPALLNHFSTIGEYRSLIGKIEEYLKGMEELTKIKKLGEKFHENPAISNQLNPTYESRRILAFQHQMESLDGTPYSNKIGKVEELELLRDLGIERVRFYRENLWEGFISLFEKRMARAGNGNHIIKYIKLDNHLSPFTAYPVSHPIELIFSTSFGRLYEDADLIDPKDMGFLVERANTVFRNFAKFSHLYIGSRTYKEAAIRELIHDWNMASARLEAILGLLGQVGYDPEKSFFHLTRDITGFQIVDMRTNESLLGESDIEHLEVANLNIGFYGFDQTKFMRPVILGSLGHEWQEQLVPVETIIEGMEIDS